MSIDMQQMNLGRALNDINGYRLKLASAKLTNPDTNISDQVKKRLTEIITSNSPAKSQNSLS